MSKQWNKDYRGIGILLEPQVVRVRNDMALRAQLYRGKQTAAYKLALHILRTHRRAFPQRIRISVRSLACEIYGHYLIKEYAERLELRFGEHKLTTWLKLHMQVIDCGDMKSDNNRFVWDLFSYVFRVPEEMQKPVQKNIRK